MGAWLVALAVAAAVAVRERDLGRMLVPAVTYTAFGVFQLLVVLRYSAQFRADDPWFWTYVGVLAVIVWTGGYGWWAAVRRPEQSVPDPAGLPAEVPRSASHPSRNPQ